MTFSQSWHDAITKAKHIYSRLKQGSSWDGYNIKYGSTTETLGVKKSPMNSSMGSRVSSLNNSHRLVFFKNNFVNYFPKKNLLTAVQWS